MQGKLIKGSKRGNLEGVKNLLGLLLEAPKKMGLALIETGSYVSFKNLQGVTGYYIAMKEG